MSVLGYVLSSFAILTIVFAIVMRFTRLQPVSGHLKDWSEWESCPKCKTVPHHNINRKREYIYPQYGGDHPVGFDNIVETKECLNLLPCDVSVPITEFMAIGSKQSWGMHNRDSKPSATIQRMFDRDPNLRSVAVAHAEQIRETNYLEHTFDIIVPGKYALDYRAFSTDESTNSFYSWDSASSEWTGEYISDRVRGWTTYTREYSDLTEGKFTVRLSVRELGLGLASVTLRFVE